MTDTPKQVMQTIGFVGMGRIGFPICQHMINNGYRVLGYRRSESADFERLGGIRARSPAEIGEQADIIFTCLPNDEALEDVVRGREGLLRSARPGQIVVEFGSHDADVKERYVVPFLQKGVAFLDGEVSGTPGMVAARKGVIYLAGNRAAADKLGAVIGSFAESCLFLGPFGAATKVKTLNNLLVALHIAGTAQTMAIGLRAGVDIDLMIKAIAGGSGGSTAFTIRAPWMAQRRFLPIQGSAVQLVHYLDRARALARQVGAGTALLDSLIETYRGALPMIGERDVASMLEFFENIDSKVHETGKNDLC
jgi:3-hydroxyisobutyrate dehydrogenase-like beta-hydroxyacid dehydrogenase